MNREALNKSSGRGGRRVWNCGGVTPFTPIIERSPCEFVARMVLRPFDRIPFSGWPLFPDHHIRFTQAPAAHVGHESRLARHSLVRFDVDRLAIFQVWPAGQAAPCSRGSSGAKRLPTTSDTVPDYGGQWHSPLWQRMHSWRYHSGSAHDRVPGIVVAFGYGSLFRIRSSHDGSWTTSSPMRSDGHYAREGSAAHFSRQEYSSLAFELI